MKLDLDRIGTELGQRDRKQYICSNGQKRQASRLGVKYVYEEWLLQWQNWRMKLGWGKEIENSTFAPMAKQEKQAGFGEKAEKQNICSNRKKEEASCIGGKAEK